MRVTSFTRSKTWRAVVKQKVFCLCEWKYLINIPEVFDKIIIYLFIIILFDPRDYLPRQKLAVVKGKQYYVKSLYLKPTQQFLLLIQNSRTYLL